MTRFRFSNRVKQTGEYKTAVPDYISLASGAAPNGLRTFAEAATADTWADGDYAGVLIYKTDDNQLVWTGRWNATYGRIEKVTEELAFGSINDGDVVTVSLVETASMLNEAMLTPYEGRFVVVTATTYTLQASDAGKTICTTSSVSCDVTIPTTLPVGFQCQLVQEGAGVLTVDTSSSDTINGSAPGTGRAPSARYAGIFLYQRSEGAWIAVGGGVPA